MNKKLAEVELVIKIPEEKYALCKKQWDTECLDTLMIAVKYGTPLPKGHGRLIDVDWLLNKMVNADADTLPRTPNEYYAWNFAKTLLTQAPTIIEADKESD